MLLEATGGRPLVFFGGKGGVGKTTLASAAAVQMAASGTRVLLVSTDPAHNLGHLFGCEIGGGRVRLAEGLFASELDPETCVAAHLARVRDFLRGLMPQSAHGEIDRHLERSRGAPGLAEAALLERLADLAEEVAEGGGPDGITRLVCDTAPTGHTLSLLSLPEMMTAWTDGMLGQRDDADRFSARARALGGGRGSARRDGDIREVLMARRARLAGLRGRLTDREMTGFVVATLAERMPVLETLALVRGLSAASISVPAIVVNRLRGGARGAREAAALADLTRELPGVPLFTVGEGAAEPDGIAALEGLEARRAGGR